MTECRTCKHIHCLANETACPYHEPMRIYIVGPFSAPSKVGEAFNVAAAVKVWHLLTESGYHAFCPQAVSGPLDSVKALTPEFWYRWTLDEMRRSDAVCLVPDDEYHTPIGSSRGCSEEIEEAENRGIPVYTLADLVAVGV